MASLPLRHEGQRPLTEIVRLDRYTISINGKHIRATPDQERRIREFTPEQRQNFIKTMQGDDSE